MSELAKSGDMAKLIHRFSSVPSVLSVVSVFRLESSDQKRSTDRKPLGVASR
jgi:hypothetical protein